MAVTWNAENFLQQLKEAPVDPKELEYFKSIPSVASWANDPNYIKVLTPSRIPKDHAEDTFFAKTIATPTTVPHWLMLAHNDIFSETPSQGEPVRGGPDRPDAVLLAHLGPGVNGFLNTAHGGLLTSLLDESLSFCVEFCRHKAMAGRETMYTANLNVNFRRPVMTPGVVLIKTWLEKRDDRKWYVKGLILNSDGAICNDATGLWISVKPQKL